jgi:hypothetical protein
MTLSAMTRPEIDYMQVLRPILKAAILLATIGPLTASPATAKTSRAEQIGGRLASFLYEVLFAAITGEDRPDVDTGQRPPCSPDDYRRYEAYAVAKDVALARQLYRTCDLSKTVTLLDEEDTVLIQDLFRVPDEHCTAYSTILETAFARFRPINPDITKDPVVLDNPTGILRPQFSVSSKAMIPSPASNGTLWRGVFAAACKPGEGLYAIYIWKLKPDKIGP